MKTVRIQDEDHAQLIAYAAYLTIEKKAQVDLSEAIHSLLERMLREEQKK